MVREPNASYIESLAQLHPAAMSTDQSPVQSFSCHQGCKLIFKVSMQKSLKSNCA